VVLESFASVRIRRFWGFFPCLFLSPPARLPMANERNPNVSTFQYNDGKEKKPSTINRTKHTNTPSPVRPHTPPAPSPPCFFHFPFFLFWLTGASGPTQSGPNPQIKTISCRSCNQSNSTNKIQNCYRSYTHYNNKIIIII
jgi:hypothetical protein